MNKRANPVQASRPSPLAALKVIDRLEIGPVHLERSRITTPYRVFQGEREDATELVFRYEEPVFEREDGGTRNLASQIGAQVAINYGLFCDSIVFHGPFDRFDRSFIKAMVENTSREIYVNKFLHPNPFLIGEAARLKPEKQRRYCQAELVFADSEPDESGVWKVDSERYSVLSSGGKDSLLTFGLVDELGFEVHPVFGNESGRHWFTALNAYRHFRDAYPARTARVWMNSDRVFNWMLRHLPFVRPDFSEIRADIYPIRLWTVAVFLFGALPILKKRGIGRLLIGDEHDSTARKRFHGITHYDGLYDQSLYFDVALTRYFSKKGWGLEQFSILRPLSEILIQKTLVERYPRLQAQQVSCHAAHTVEDRVFPCGKCEKCRRIVSMLIALGADAGNCGYSEEQVNRCLADLVNRGIHQEAPAVRHLLHLLQQRGEIELSEAARKSARLQPEVMSLRFDDRRSPRDAVPYDLRVPLLSILLEHAQGAVVKVNGKWEALREPSSPQEAGVEGAVKGTPASRGESPVRPLGELTWPEAKRRFKEVDVALLPVGAIEQHGPHLPLDTDSFDAEYLAHEVASRCSSPRPIVLPLIPYGVSYHHDDFSGTISIGNETLARFVHEIGMSAARNGIKKLIIVNGHGGNDPSLNFAAQTINRDAHIFVCVDSGHTSDVDVDGIAETPNDVHAGEIETSTSLAVRPWLVKMEKARKLVPRFSSRYLDFSSKRSVSWYAYTERISASGVMGDPTKASAEKGHRIWKLTIQHLVNLVEDLKDLTLDEIYQKRY